MYVLCPLQGKSSLDGSVGASRRKSLKFAVDHDLQDENGNRLDFAHLVSLHFCFTRIRSSLDTHIYMNKFYLLPLLFFYLP